MKVLFRPNSGRNTFRTVCACVVVRHPEVLFGWLQSRVSGLKGQMLESSRMPSRTLSMGSHWRMTSAWTAVHSVKPKYRGSLAFKPVRVMKCPLQDAR